MTLTRTFVNGGVACEDIRYFLGISERTVKRHFKRGKGQPRSGFHLNQVQKKAIVELHHKSRDLFEISRQIELPAKYVLKSEKGRTEKAMNMNLTLYPPSSFYFQNTA